MYMHFYDEISTNYKTKKVLGYRSIRYCDIDENQAP